MKIDHIGYAVKRMDRAMAAFEVLGFHFGEAIDDADRNVKIAFGENDGCRIELVAPLDRETPSPVDGQLRKLGPTPYHLCYISPDLDGERRALEAQGFRTVLEPAPAVAFGGRRVAFMAHAALGLMEIVEG